MTDDSKQRGSTPEELPSALINDLSEVYDARLVVPPDLDEAILRKAGDHLRPLRRRPRWTRIGAQAAAAAVILGAGLAILFIATSRQQPHQQHATLAGADINHDGAVDIVDAFVLARGLTSPPPTRS